MSNEIVHRDASNCFESLTSAWNTSETRSRSTGDEQVMLRPELEDTFAHLIKYHTHLASSSDQTHERHLGHHSSPDGPRLLEKPRRQTYHHLSTQHEFPPQHLHPSVLPRCRANHGPVLRLWLQWRKRLRSTTVRILCTHATPVLNQQHLIETNHDLVVPY